MLTDAGGTQPACLITAANVADGLLLLPSLDGCPAIGGRRGRPRRPLLVTADKAYHSTARVEELHRRGIYPLLPQRGELGTAGLGKVRWVIERTMAWLKQFRWLRNRYERHPDIHLHSSNSPAASSAGGGSSELCYTL